MFENLTVFQTASALARHAGQTQAVVARNIANADTPGYIGKQMVPFSALYSGDGAGGPVRATRAQHLDSNRSINTAMMTDLGSADSPNGNRVSLESELLKAADAKSSHDRALAIYKSALDVLRAAVRTR